MSLKEELIELNKKITETNNRKRNNAILLHAKAHMYNNKRMHDKALKLMDKHGIECDF